jgi:hypothetical protein
MNEVILATLNSFDDFTSRIVHQAESRIELLHVVELTNIPSAISATLNETMVLLDPGLVTA